MKKKHASMSQISSLAKSLNLSPSVGLVKIVEQYVAENNIQLNYVVGHKTARKFLDTLLVGKVSNLKQSKWQKLRYQAFVKYGNVCACCGPKDGVKMHVDHIKPKSIYPELEYELDNLQILCSECNIAKSNKNETNWKNYLTNK